MGILVSFLRDLRKTFKPRRILHDKKLSFFLSDRFIG